MQIEWARQLGERTLILAPLAVAQQTVREGVAMGIPVTYARSQAAAAPNGITITNYEMLGHFDPAAFGAVVLDESGILKNYSGVVKRSIIAAFRQTPYRLSCTATPASSAGCARRSRHSPTRSSSAEASPAPAAPDWEIPPVAREKMKPRLQEYLGEAVRRSSRLAAGCVVETGACA